MSEERTRYHLGANSSGPGGAMMIPSAAKRAADLLQAEIEDLSKYRLLDNSQRETIAENLDEVMDAAEQLQLELLATGLNSGEVA